MTDNAIPFANYSDEPIYNIQAVAEQTDVPALTLRAWERRYDLPKPQRDEQGHRLYSERDIVIIKWLKQQVDSSMRIKQAVKLLQTQAPQHLTIGQSAPPAISLDEPMTNQFQQLAEELFTAIKEFDYARAQMILTHALSIYSIEDVCLGIIVPTFQYIDYAYQSGDITLQQEHFGSNLIRERLQGILTTPATPSRTGRIVVGCAPHEWHEIGALMFALFLRRRGWEIIYLGQNVGLAGLHDTISHLRPDALTISFTHIPNIRFVEDIARIMNEATNQRGIFTFAGRVFSHFPELVEKLPGAYLGGNLIGAVEQIEQLLNERWRPPEYIPPQRTPEVNETLEYVHEHRANLESALAEILATLVDSGEQADPFALAHALMDILAISLQYQAPEMLEYLHAPDNIMLDTYGLSQAQLPELIDQWRTHIDSHTPPTVAQTLGEFVKWLEPDTA